MESLIHADIASVIDLGPHVRVTPSTGDLPMVISPLQPMNWAEWATEHKAALNDLLLDQGAVLLRGFAIEGAQGFNKLFTIIAGDAMEYKNRTSPREQVYNNVYTSTSHPNDQQIHMHTENSYSLTFNRVIAFYCLIPPKNGGETPIADERRLLKSLKPETVDKFRAKGIRYLRNSIPGIGLDWRTIYQTTDKNTVNKYLSENGFEFTWISDEQLRVSWTLPAFQAHPMTGEEMWFNHMYFGLKDHYDPQVLEYFSEEDLPFVAYFGDGSDIDTSIVRELKDFYRNNSIVFKWEKDDFLLLDNMMYSHGRNPFDGSRKILTAMAQPLAFIR